MNGVEQYEQRRTVVLFALARRVAASRTGRIVAWSAAAVACLLRAGAIVAVLLTPA
jgi:hypothetical protein